LVLLFIYLFQGKVGALKGSQYKHKSPETLSRAFVIFNHSIGPGQMTLTPKIINNYLVESRTA
jgi:hypothetical protein